jgi:arginine N-succinyltransferase
MSYAEADLLSSENKEFIRDLFPRGDIYASVLSQEAQDVIGKVGAQTKGVEKMLRRIGFRYAERVDPFDGGPHFVAQADEITLVKDTKKLRLAGPLASGDGATMALVAREYAEAPWFRALFVPVEVEPKGAVRIPEEAMVHLGAGEGDELACLPIR